jgi:uncharacterized domain 1
MFSNFLGAKIEELNERYVKVKGKVKEEYLNVHNTAHGSYIFALADIAFEAISNYSEKSVALHMDIDFRNPAYLNDELTVEGFLESKGNKTSLYRFVVKRKEDMIAEILALAYHIR